MKISDGLCVAVATLASVVSISGASMVQQPSASTDTNSTTISQLYVPWDPVYNSYVKTYDGEKMEIWALKTGFRVQLFGRMSYNNGNQSGLVGDQQLGGAPQVTVGESSDRGVEADGCHVALDLVHLAAATPKVLRLGGRADRHAATDLKTRQDTGSSACGQLGVTFIDRSAERVQ
jgi:hypothetical protein